MSRDRTIARPYAKAVFELAYASDALAHWSDMLALAAEVACAPEVIDLMKDPNFSTYSAFTRAALSNKRECK